MVTCGAFAWISPAPDRAGATTRLRPDYPEALEYPEAEDLARAIAAASAR